MGVLSVVEKVDGPRSGKMDRLWRREYVRTFVVETDSPSVGAIAVRTAVAAITMGSWYTNGLVSTDPNYEYDQGAWVTDIDCQLDSGTGGVQWTATVNYGPYDTSTFGSDPTLWPVRVAFGGERTEQVVYFDKTGAPVRNSAGDRFGDPVTIPDHLLTLVITRNELVSAFGLAVPATYSDTTNTAVWNGFAAGQCLMGMITTSDPQYDSNNHVYYLTVTYPVTIARSGQTWVKSLLDQGFNQLDSSSPAKPVPITNSGQPVSDPVPLDGSGQRLASTGTPVTLTFDVYPDVDWSPLNIDLSLRLGH